VTRRVKCAGDRVVFAKEDTVLHAMIDRLVEVGRCYGMEKNVEKSKVTRISWQPYQIQIMIDQK
jgi:hypothetical protein